MRREQAETDSPTRSAMAVTGVSASVCSRARMRRSRGVFHSLVSSQAAINRFLVEANENPKPFRWTKDPDKIITAVRRGHQALASLH